MIVSFGDKTTRDLFHGRWTNATRALPQAVRVAAVQKLDLLNAAVSLLDMQSPPGNRLEAMKGNLKGFYSVRVNNQWRLVFRFMNGAAHEVKLMDYHS
jgi:proteic killer suppression protein